MSSGGFHIKRVALAGCLAAGLAGAWQFGMGGRRWEPAPPQDHTRRDEYHFLRMEYQDMRWTRRGAYFPGWWRQDWPEADAHFTHGIRRLTRIHVGEPRHLPLLDDRIFEYPWIYATQTGYWDLTEAEKKRLREYLLRGGFLVTDDFHGPREWAIFAETMRGVLPEAPILEIEEGHPLLRVMYDIEERVPIPGLRHLREGPGGSVTVQMQYGPPRWRAMHDSRGHLVVAINYNMDVGDAWEHADMPEYPEAMTALAYRFGLNYIIYAMTH